MSLLRRRTKIVCHHSSSGVSSQILMKRHTHVDLVQTYTSDTFEHGQDVTEIECLWILLVISLKAIFDGTLWTCVP